MNYSDIEQDDEIINDINNIKINNNSAKIFLDDYKNLKKTLVDYKNKLKNLTLQKETFENYLNNLFNNHLNIVNIINNFNDNNLNNSFIEYQKNIKENYEKWIKFSYNNDIKNIEENIEDIELKLRDFTLLFKNIINNIVTEKEISKNICPICFENEIDICITPCGHTTCNNCIMSNSNFYNNKCFTCRSPVNEYIKLYFSL
jgi:hypothetical protein